MEESIEELKKQRDQARAEAERLWDALRLACGHGPGSQCDQEPCSTKSRAIRKLTPLPWKVDEK